ncbi:flagellar hook-basal body complex protein [Lyticum sinuosum]|uniref:Flagellar hook protein FlgE n=1 Tax=Lyticum sinuosum TaxID=1332059 RepID=A0AAE5AHA8_9RICK|nr:flagellar hook-basal body complex protein [Lyticum sinuosum]MDZ5760893.1 Flagellar hook protein FlgE [Lyticum sinuosum]
MSTYDIPSGMAASLLGMKYMEDKISICAQNISNIDTKGFKEKYLISTEALYGGVYEQPNARISDSGTIEIHNSQTALAVTDSSGMFAVKNISGELFYTPTGNFPLNKNSIMELQSGGYFLQGWKYDEDTQKYTRTLSDIKVDNDIKSKPTDSILTNFKLSNNSIAESVGGTFTINVNNTDSSELLNLDSFSHNSFYIDTLKEVDGISKTETLKFLFGGISKTTKDGSSSSISTASPTGSFDIIVEGLSLGKITASEIISSGDNDQQVLTKLQNKFKSLGLRSDIITSNNNKTLLVAPNNANNSMKFVGNENLLSIIGLSPESTIDYANYSNQNYYRFASVKELASLMKANGLDVNYNPSSKSQVVVSALKNCSLTLCDNSVNGNLLYDLGIVSSSNVECLPIDSNYDCYVPSSAISNNPNVVPDLLSDFVIYDSLGIKHIMYAGFIRLSGYDWAMEVYGNAQDIDDSTNYSGIVQASKLSFSPDGDLVSISAFPISSYSNPLKISTPFEEIGSSGDNFNITAGNITKNYVQGTDFTNISELSNKINADFSNLKSTIVQNSLDNNSYLLKITPESSSIIIETSGTASVSLGMQRSRDNVLPSLNDELKIKWRGLNGASPEESSIRFFYEKNNIDCISSTMRCAMENNGYKSATLNDINIDDGVVIGIYDNGEKLNLYKVPLAICNNVNKMGVLDNGLFSETVESGKVTMIESEKGGAGKILSQRIEGSNVNLSDNLTNIAITSQYHQGIGVVAKTQIGLMDVIIALSNA